MFPVSSNAKPRQAELAALAVDPVALTARPAHRAAGTTEGRGAARSHPGPTRNGSRHRPPARCASLRAEQERDEAVEARFRDAARTFQVLALLAFFGRHDGDLEAALDKVHGAQARWRAKDSHETTFGSQRTWIGSNSTRKLFRRHITLGRGVDAQRTAVGRLGKAHATRYQAVT